VGKDKDESEDRHEISGHPWYPGFCKISESCVKFVGGSIQNFMGVVKFLKNHMTFF
jgi:hypothetical protein